MRRKKKANRVDARCSRVAACSSDDWDELLQARAADAEDEEEEDFPSNALTVTVNDLGARRSKGGSGSHGKKSRALVSAQTAAAETGIVCMFGRSSSPTPETNAKPLSITNKSNRSRAPNSAVAPLTFGGAAVAPQGMPLALNRR